MIIIKANEPRAIYTWYKQCDTPNYTGFFLIEIRGSSIIDCTSSLIIPMVYIRATHVPICQSGKCQASVSWCQSLYCVANLSFAFISNWLKYYYSLRNLTIGKTSIAAWYASETWRIQRIRTTLFTTLWTATGRKMRLVCYYFFLFFIFLICLISREILTEKKKKKMWFLVETVGTDQIHSSSSWKADKIEISPSFQLLAKNIARQIRSNRGNRNHAPQLEHCVSLRFAKLISSSMCLVHFPIAHFSNSLNMYIYA